MTRSQSIAAGVVVLIAIALSILWGSAGDEPAVTESDADEPASGLRQADGVEAGGNDSVPRVPSGDVSVPDRQSAPDTGALSESERLWESTDPRAIMQRRKLNPVLWWPQSPETTESLIYNAFVSALPEIVSLEPVVCDETSCEAVFVTTLEGGGFPADPQGEMAFSPELFTSIANDPALRDLGVVSTGFGNREGPDGIRRAYLRMESFAQVPNNPTLDDQALIEAANRARGSERVTQPLILGTYENRDVILSGSCAFDCPDPNGYVIMFNVPPYSSCDEIGGVEQSISWNSRSGVEPYVACVPTVLLAPEN